MTARRLLKAILFWNVGYPIGLGLGWLIWRHDIARAERLKHHPVRP